MAILWRKPDSWYFELHTTQKPDGTVIEQGQVRHPGSVLLIPIDDDHNILMLHQYRRAVAQTIWELPAGTKGWDEDWLVCAQRELREETGVRAAQFTHLGQIWPAPSHSDEVMQLYVAQKLTADPLPADFDEQIEVVPLPFDEAIAMALDGRLQDAKSVVAILRAAQWRSSAKR